MRNIGDFRQWKDQQCTIKPSPDSSGTYELDARIYGPQRHSPHGGHDKRELKGTPMANRAHIAMLKRGVEAWNDWRQKNPHITPDLSQVTVPARALGGANLAHANLTLSSLPFAILEDADLSGANLELANLSLASLMSANLRAAHLHGRSEEHTSELQSLRHL